MKFVCVFLACIKYIKKCAVAVSTVPGCKCYNSNNLRGKYMTNIFRRFAPYWRTHFFFMFAWGGWVMHIPFPSFHPSFTLIRKLEQSNSFIASVARMLQGVNRELSKDENAAEASRYAHKLTRKLTRWHTRKLTSIKADWQSGSHAEKQAKEL